jgi:hypothetical protein
MVMLLFRFLSLVLIVAALMLLGADAVGTLEAGGEVKLRTLESLWVLFDPAGLEPLKAWVQSQPDALATPANMVLSWPAWAALGLVGVLLALVFRHQPEDEWES